MTLPECTRSSAKEDMVKNAAFFSFVVFIVALCAFPVFGGMPHVFWPEKDIASKEINLPSCAHKILIASRESDYKTGVVRKLAEELSSDSVYIKITGVRMLKKEKQKDYNAVVILNTCMGWRIDSKVKRFLKKCDIPSSVIVYTTSADIRWRPKMRKLKFDSITSASETDKTGEIVKVIADRIRKNAGLVQ
jgi:DNA-directed RNA polymerase subunit RPC12/RpoP